RPVCRPMKAPLCASVMMMSIKAPSVVCTRAPPDRQARRMTSRGAPSLPRYCRVRSPATAPSIATSTSLTRCPPQKRSPRSDRMVISLPMAMGRDASMCAENATGNRPPVPERAPLREVVGGGSEIARSPCEGAPPGLVGDGRAAPPLGEAHAGALGDRRQRLVDDLATRFRNPRLDRCIQFSEDDQGALLRRGGERLECSLAVRFDFARNSLDESMRIRFDNLMNHKLQHRFLHFRSLVPRFINGHVRPPAFLLVLQVAETIVAELRSQQFYETGLAGRW